MNWIDCLALSTPPSVAFYFGIRAWIAHRVVADETDRLSRETDARLARSAAKRLARIAADAAIKSAKYAAGIIKRKPAKEEPAEKTVFADWMEQVGYRKSQEVCDMVEWAMSYIAGEDSGSEAGDAASPSGAKAILDEHAGAGWWQAAVARAKRGR